MSPRRVDGYALAEQATDLAIVWQEVICQCVCFLMDKIAPDRYTRIVPIKIANDYRPIVAIGNTTLFYNPRDQIDMRSDALCWCFHCSGLGVTCLGDRCQPVNIASSGCIRWGAQKKMCGRSFDPCEPGWYCDRRSLHQGCEWRG